MDAELQAWQATLPDWLQASTVVHPLPWFYLVREKLFWRYCNFRIILHRRAFLERVLHGRPLNSLLDDDNPLELECARICMQSARDTIRGIHRLFVTNNACATPKDSFEIWYGIHYILHACHVPLIALHTNQHSPDVPVWHEDVAKTREFMNKVKFLPGPRRFLQIVDLLEPPAPRTNSPVADNAWMGLLQQLPVPDVPSTEAIPDGDGTASL